jgi:hypothetical protein
MAGEEGRGGEPGGGELTAEPARVGTRRNDRTAIDRDTNGGFVVRSGGSEFGFVQH